MPELGAGADMSGIEDGGAQKHALSQSVRARDGLKRGATQLRGVNQRLIFLDR